MAEKIIIEYTPEKKDYIQASRLLARKTTFFVVLASMILVAMAASVILLLNPSLRNTVWVNIATVVLIVCLFYIFYYLVLIPFQLSRTYQRADSLKMIRQYTFSDEHVLMKIGDNSSILPWDKFQRVMAGKEIYLMIYVDENRVYPLVPKRSFSDRAIEDAFLSLIRSKSIPVV